MVDVVLRGGRSFKGVGSYVLDGPRGKPRPTDALGEILYFNLPAVREPRHAFGIMAATARDADALKELAGVGPGGRTGEKPVYHFVLSWSIDEPVTEEQVLAAAEEALLKLGLEDRQAVAIVHHDTDHLHVHIVANRCSPEDGRFANMGRDRIKLSRWAKQWEQRTFGRTFCRRPYRDENLRVVRSTDNPPGKYPIRYRNRKRPGRDEHHREAWRRLLADQRAELAAASRAGDDVAALERRQKTERVKLARRLREEERRQPKEPDRVDPEKAATGATTGQDRAPDTADGANALATDKPGPAKVSEPAQRSPERDARSTLSGPADDTLPVPIPEPDHAREVEHVEATGSRQPSTAGGDVSALERQQKTERVQRSRPEQHRRLEDPTVGRTEVATGATSGHDRAPNMADAAKAPAAKMPASVTKVSEPAQRSPEREAPRAPSGPVETRPVPIPKPAHVLEVERVEEAEIQKTTATTTERTPTPQAVQRRTGQQTPKPTGWIRIPTKSVGRDSPQEMSGRSPDRRHRQESTPASPVAPPQQTRRDADSRPTHKSTEQPRVREQRRTEDGKRSADGKAGGSVKSMRDRPVDAAGRPMKREPDGQVSIRRVACPVRNDSAGAAASPVRTALPTPPAAADDETRAAVAEPVRAQGVSGGEATGSKQTDAPATGVVPVRSAAQRRTPTQAVECSDSRRPAKSADTVLPNARPGRVVDAAHPPKSKSSPTTTGTLAEMRSDDVRPSTVCLKDYGRNPTDAVAVVAAVAGIKIMRSRGDRPRRGVFRNNFLVPTMPTPDAQHAYDLWFCATLAPPLAALDDEQRAVAAASVAEGLAAALGTRSTFDAGRKQMKEWPPPAAAPLRDIIWRAMQWFVQRLQQFFERRRKKTNRTIASVRADLGRFAGTGSIDDPARSFARRAVPSTTARNHPGRTSANRVPGTTTPHANGGLGNNAGAASRTSDRTASRTPPVAASGRLPAKSTGDDSMLGTSRRTGDRLHPSTSRPTAPPATSTPTAATPDRVRPAVPQGQVPSIRQVTPEADRWKAATSRDSRPGVPQATDSLDSLQSVSARTAIPTGAGTSSGGRVGQMIADLVATQLEAAHLRRSVTVGTLAMVREAAGGREDIRLVVDALIRRAEYSDDRRERERGEREYLEHRLEVLAARKPPAKPEPEQSLSARFKRFVGWGESETPETATSSPDPPTVDEVRRGYAGELLEIIGNVVRDWPERLAEPPKPAAGTSRSYRDERWRVGLGPTPDHDHHRQYGR